MTTLNELLEELAKELNSRLTNWEVLAEIPNNEILENKNMIAILHMTANDEVIKGNKTFRLDLALTGQIMMQEFTKEFIIEQIKEIELTVANFCKELHYTEAKDCVLIEGTSDLCEYGQSDIYMNFTVPFELIVQF